MLLNLGLFSTLADFFQDSTQNIQQSVLQTIRLSLNEGRHDQISTRYPRIDNFEDGRFHVLQNLLVMLESPEKNIRLLSLCAIKELAKHGKS